MIADNTNIYAISGAVITNNGDSDLKLNNLYITDENSALKTTSTIGKSVIFNKIVFTANTSNLTGSATIVTDTLQYVNSSVNQIEGNKKIVINNLIAPASPCNPIEIKSTNTTPAILSSTNCNMMIRFARLSYITADISGSCSASGYNLYGKAVDQTSIANWTFHPTEGSAAELLGPDTVLLCSSLPYIQNTAAFGKGKTYTWKYSPTLPANWNSVALYGGNTDTIHISKAGYYWIDVKYNETCNLSATHGRHFTTIIDEPALIIYPPGVANINETIMLTGNGTSDCRNYVWTVDGGNLISGQGTNEIQVSFATTGVKTVTLQYENERDCRSTLATKLITVSSIPNFTFDDVTSCLPVDLTALVPATGSITGLAMEYFDGSDQRLADSTSVNAGTYRIKGTNPENLSYTDTVIVSNPRNEILVSGMLFVKTTPSGDRTGSSWDNAFDGKNLAWYLREKAVDGTRIYVAAGTYFPYLAGCDNAAIPRDFSFELNKKIEIYGGFPANASGTTITNSSPKTHITRLSGDIGTVGETSDNTYHVVKITASTGTLLDGFHISDGHGNGTNGAGLFGVNNAVVQVSNTVIENNATEPIITTEPPNSTGGYGAGMHTNGETKLTNVTVSNNSAGVNGGGVYASLLTLSNTTVSDNTATGAGAGIVVTGTLTLKGDIVINGNRSTGTSGHGGGMYFSGSSIVTTDLTSLKITNSKGVQGGGICFAGNSNITIDGSNTSVIISGNTASRGGAIHSNAAVSLKIVNVTISDNTAVVSGGGINTQGTLELENTSFSGNTGPSTGGAVSTTGASLSVNACTFVKNTSTAGGAIYTATTSNTSIRNTTFSQNKAMGTRPGNSTSGSSIGAGGAVKVGTGNLSVMFSTFNGNEATNNEGHAIYLGSEADKTLNGNIIYGNGDTGSEIDMQPASASYNIVRNMEPAGTGNLNAGTGNVANIFAAVVGDVATLADNSGTTKTLGIKPGGLAHNFIPTDVAETWGVIPYDQRGAGFLRSKGCKTDAGSFEIQAADVPTVIDITGPAEACTGDRMSYGATTGMKAYQWELLAGGLIDDSSTTDMVIINWGTIVSPPPYNVKVTVTDNNNCNNTVTFPVTVKVRSITGPMFRLPNGE